MVRCLEATLALEEAANTSTSNSSSAWLCSCLGSRSPRPPDRYVGPSSPGAAPVGPIHGGYQGTYVQRTAITNVCRRLTHHIMVLSCWGRNRGTKSAGESYPKRCRSRLLWKHLLRGANALPMAVSPGASRCAGSMVPSLYLFRETPDHKTREDHGGQITPQLVPPRCNYARGSRRILRCPHGQPSP